LLSSPPHAAATKAKLAASMTILVSLIRTLLSP
jgi:hypothetical protein